MSSAREAPAYEDADECVRPCCCRECVDLDAPRRAQAGYWLRVRCGCLICQAGLLRK